MVSFIVALIFLSAIIHKIYNTWIQDENQKVTTKDIGSIQLIEQYAKEEGSIIYRGDELNLISQFRCNGSNSYLTFLDHLLEINKAYEKNQYELDIFLNFINIS